MPQWPLSTCFFQIPPLKSESLPTLPAAEPLTPIHVCTFGMLGPIPFSHPLVRTTTKAAGLQVLGFAMLAMDTTSSAAEAGLYLHVTEWVWIAGALVGFWLNGVPTRRTFLALFRLGMVRNHQRGSIHSNISHVDLEVEPTKCEANKGEVRYHGIQ